MYTLAEVRDACADVYWEDFAYSNSQSVQIGSEAVLLTKVAAYTGSEGDYSADTHVVFKIGDQVFKKTGAYRSHYGNDWDGPLIEVAPVEKTVTVYEEKRNHADYSAEDVRRAVENENFEYYSDYWAKQGRNGWTAVDGWDELSWNDGRVFFEDVEHAWKVEVDESGGEGHGEYAFIVFSITAPDGSKRLFRKEGAYASHYGTEWDGEFAEVEAYEKTVTDYRKV